MFAFLPQGVHEHAKVEGGTAGLNKAYIQIKTITKLSLISIEL